jgi:hypothetical protein
MASQVKFLLLEACIYLTNESSDALASLMTLRIQTRQAVPFQPLLERYSVAATSTRLESFFSQVLAKNS